MNIIETFDRAIWQVCEYILGLQKIAGDGFSINATDSLFGETGECDLDGLTVKVVCFSASDIACSISDIIAHSCLHFVSAGFSTCIPVSQYCQLFI